MITLQSQLHVDALKGNEIVNFLLTCTDQSYQAWWPGTHLQLHTRMRCPNSVGNIVFMDEFIGKRRIQMLGVVRIAEPTKIVWQLKKGIPLPVWLTLELADDAAGVTITHTIRASRIWASSLTRSSACTSRTSSNVRWISTSRPSFQRCVTYCVTLTRLRR